MASPCSFDEAMGSENESPEHGAADERPARKRARLSSRLTSQLGNDDFDSSDTSNRPVLPDEFRRSPQNTRATHQPGSIVRVKLNNFVTYTNAEFHPGPNLNMIIGPNGTGKSTLVCAICLGLGWGTVNLGRAKDIAEFVKHGSTEATIEIELARDPRKQEQNPVITTRIHKTGKSTDFLLNGRQSTKKEIRKLASDYSIQVDNLCQFLPQDRVVEFAGLSPVQLLTQTQRAAAPAYMSEWHDELKTLGKEMRTRQDEQQALLESLKKNESRQRAQEADVQRIREHSSLQDRLVTLQKLKPFPQYVAKKAEYSDAKQTQKHSEKQLRRLHRQLQPNLEAVNTKQAYLTSITNALTSKKKITERLEKEISTINQKYETKNRELKNKQSAHDTEKDKMKETRASVSKIKHNIQKIQNDMQNQPPVFNFATTNEEVRELTRRDRALGEQEDDVKEHQRELKGQVTQHQAVKNRKEAEKSDLQSQLGQQTSKLAQISPATAELWKWIEEHKDQFSGPVYPPAIISCSIKDRRHTAAIENMLGRRFGLSFTVTNQGDFDLMQEHMYGARSSTDVWTTLVLRELHSFTPPCSEEHRRDLALEGWLIDLIEGPGAVLAMLCDNCSLESVGYTNVQLDGRQFDRLSQSSVTTWATPKDLSRVTRRREYGDKAVSTSVASLRSAQYFTDAPVNHDRERALERQLNELQDELQSLKDSAAVDTKKLVDIREERKELSEQRKAKQDAKDAQQRMLTAFQALPTKLEGEQDKLKAIEDKIKNFENDCNQHHDDLDQLHMEKGQIALNHANTVEQVRISHMEVLGMELTDIEAKSDLTQLKAHRAEEARQLQQHQEEVARLTDICQILREEALTLQTTCTDIGADLSASENVIFEEVQQFTPEQLELEIQSAGARLEINTGGNHGIIKEYDTRAKHIDRQHSQLEDIKNALETLENQVQEIQQKWEPELEGVIEKISASFSENFASIHCAGEVGLYKDENFEQWAIQIKVKFREQEQLSILDARRQSGGERAVSTIFYLMALQSLARAPFRVVDEINQGMDPRNERLVHSRLVDIACQSVREDGGGGSQYFLITPKLLPELEYHPNMKVHCIASGEYMPTDHSLLDFGKLAQRALAVQSA